MSLKPVRLIRALFDREPRPQNQHKTLCPAEILHVYVIRGKFGCLPSWLKKRRASTASLDSLHIHVIAVLRQANYHRELGTWNRSVLSIRLGDCTADLDVTAVRMTVLPGNSR